MVLHTKFRAYGTKIELPTSQNVVWPSLYDESPRRFLQSTAWHKCSQDNKQEYVDVLNDSLLGINIQHESLICDNINCKVHGQSISDIYNDVVKFCLQADNVLPKTKDNSSKNNIVAGWSEYVKEHKDMALFWHREWVDKGRPPQGMIAYNRRKTRAKYHYAIKFVNKEKNRIISNRMAQAISENDNRNLWNEAKKMKKTNNSTPNIIDNMTGSENVNELFFK